MQPSNHFDGYIAFQNASTFDKVWQLNCKTWFIHKTGVASLHDSTLEKNGDKLQCFIGLCPPAFVDCMIALNGISENFISIFARLVRIRPTLIYTVFQKNTHPPWLFWITVRNSNNLDDYFRQHSWKNAESENLKTVCLFVIKYSLLAVMWKER